MIQRKCGTCRYFEEGGIAASGWCRHPERQDLQHMVLVRKTELACRDGWDHDLWEPIDAGGPGPPARAPAMAGARNGQPEQTLSSDDREPRQHSGENYSSSPDQWDDLATSQRPDRPRAAAGESEPSPEQREQRRQRASARDSISQPNDAQSDQVRDETFSTRGLRPDAGWRRQLSEMRQHSTRPHEAVPKPPVLERAEEDETHQPSVEANSEHRGQPAEGHTFGASNWGVPEGSLDVHRPTDRRDEPPVQQSGVTEPFEFAPGEAEEQADEAVPVEPAIDPPQPVHVMDDVEDDADDGFSGPASNGSTHLPSAITERQCCRTCRDFLPADGGQRGWCNNAFAFERRQQVNGDDLACKGTYGNWWSPSDDWWIERADISHHSTPTPLVEDLIREIRDRKARQQGSTGKPERS